MVHAGYCGYWWELYRTVSEAQPTGSLLMSDDLADRIRVSEQIASIAETIGSDPGDRDVRRKPSADKVGAYHLP
jgi:hypothetical protein